MNKPFIIGIAGGSGSGKTTFLKRIGLTFPKAEICIISQDEYYRPRETQLIDDNGVTNFDLPTSIDVAHFSKDLQTLINGDVVTKTEYTFNNDLAKAKTLTFKPTKVIIVEGIFIFHYLPITKLLDFKIYIDARDDLKIIRRIKRDQIERNYPVEDVLYRYEHHVMPAYEKFTKPYKQSADVIINNHSNFESALDMMTSFLAYKLKSK
jgi:uridine kinase